MPSKRVSARVLYRQEGGIVSDMEQAAELLKSIQAAVPYGSLQEIKGRWKFQSLWEGGKRMCGRAKQKKRLYHWFASKEPYEIKNGLSDIYKEAEKNGFVKQASIIAGAMENAVKEYVKRGICSPEDSKEIRQLTESFCDLRELFGGYERFLERIESEDKEKSYSTRVIKVIRFIRQNYEKDISVGDAAQLLGLNGEYLNKLFKKRNR